MNPINNGIIRHLIINVQNPVDMWNKTKLMTFLFKRVCEFASLKYHPTGQMTSANT